MTGKYTPLENYLRGLPQNQAEVTLGFELIEKILEAKLPSSAYEDQRWWVHEKEANHVDARSWSNAGCTAGFVPTVWRTGGTTPPGWKIGGLDVNQKWVKLIRIG